MLDFRLDDEQQMLADAIARFAKEQVRKVFRDAEEEEEIPAEVVEAGWEIGVLPASIPEEFGGFGEYSAVTGVVATEEFAWGDLAITLNIMAPNQVAIPLMLCGTDAQKETYLPLFADEQIPHLTAALTEPVIQFNPYRLKTTAVREGVHYILNGTKTMVPLAAEADLILVYASEDGQTQAFLIPADTPGMTVGKRDKLMGLHALPTLYGDII